MQQQQDITKTSIIIEPDRHSNKDPDPHHNIPYRLICEVVLTNNSSLPISIIEFKLNDELIFNSYSNPGNCYSFTGKIKNKLPEHELIDDRKFTENDIQGFPIGQYFLTPLIKLEPYSSIRGYLYFKFRDKSQVTVGKNQLQIITSRKRFDFNIVVDEALYHD
ncbi:hypothetical protein [Listeria fleischmannii]|uniref:DUF4352 domain-containing protein n=1 Tax=Listeria fleischmannii FSL S10-1203 TaxID=1265822 RepID=W7DX50_9LIST|nr:hypothetical protein [Listeria fleischmannii]EUJ64821.1 hypothetical protein MCOL2_01440 [Listeria fleischmannii FSL S10-1203]